MQAPALIRFEKSCRMRLSTRGRYAVMAMVELASRAEPSNARSRAATAGEPRGDRGGAAPVARLSRTIVRAACGAPGWCCPRAGREAATGSPARPRRSPWRRSRTRWRSRSAQRAAKTAGLAASAGKRCLTHDLWAELGEQIRLFLSHVTLADVVEGRVLGRAAVPASRRFARVGDGACSACSGADARDDGRLSLPRRQRNGAPAAGSAAGGGRGARRCGQPVLRACSRAGGPTDAGGRAGKPRGAIRRGAGRGGADGGGHGSECAGRVRPRAGPAGAGRRHGARGGAGRGAARTRNGCRCGRTERRIWTRWRRCLPRRAARRRRWFA